MAERLPKAQEYAFLKPGAVVFVTDGHGRIYIHQEMEKDVVTGKKPGDYSVFCEKREPGESVESNISRGISEESGISQEVLPRLLSDRQVMWETGFVPGVWATVVVVECRDPDLFVEMISTAVSTDGVKPGRFMSREEIQGLELRDGVGNILSKYGDEIFEYAKSDFN